MKLIHNNISLKQGTVMHPERMQISEKNLSEVWRI